MLASELTKLLGRQVTPSVVRAAHSSFRHSEDVTPSQRLIDNLENMKQKGLVWYEVINGLAYSSIQRWEISWTM